MTPLVFFLIVGIVLAVAFIAFRVMRAKTLAESATKREEYAKEQEKRKQEREQAQAARKAEAEAKRIEQEKQAAERERVNSHPIFDAPVTDPQLVELKQRIRQNPRYLIEGDIRKIVGITAPTNKIRALQERLRESVRDDISPLVEAIQIPDELLGEPLPYRTVTRTSTQSRASASGSAQLIYMQEAGIGEDGLVDLGKRWDFRVSLGQNNKWDAVDDLILVLQCSYDDAIGAVTDYVDRASNSRTADDDPTRTPSPTVNPPPPEAL